MDRRILLKSIAAVTASMTPEVLSVPLSCMAQSRPQRVGGPLIKISCNLFSFNGPLTKGVMSLDEALEFCARTGFEAVDPTGYYFPGYPKVPPDDYVYHIKRKALMLGLDISGTGVRTDFTAPDKQKRNADIDLVKSWIECAVKLGAPMLRVFSGRGDPQGPDRKQVTEWVVEGLRACAELGEKSGVMIVVQNHADFIQTADDDLSILKMVNSDWIAANLDIGSFRTGDTYEQIASVAPYAITWQIKENLFVNGKETRTDLDRIAAILKNANYRGFIQLETLGEGDPRVRVPAFLERLRKAIT